MGINFFYWEQYKNVIYSPPKFSRHEIILLSVGTDGLFYTLCSLCSAHQHTILVSSYLSYVISTMVFKDTLSSLSLSLMAQVHNVSLSYHTVISWHWQWHLFVWATVSSSTLKWTAAVHEWFVQICWGSFTATAPDTCEFLWRTTDNNNKTIIKSFLLVWILCHCGGRVR